MIPFLENSCQDEKRMMNKKLIKILISAILLGVLLSSCSSNASAASSWPGFTISGGDGYFAYGTQIHALDLKNGSLLWKYPAEASSGRQFYAAPEVNSNLVIVGDYSNTLAALDKTNGAEKWQFSEAEDRYIGSALIADNMIYAPNTDHYFYALDENGALVWRFKASGPNWTKPAADENYVYLASMDHSVYAFNFSYSNSELTADADGSRTLVTQPVWSLDLGAAIVADPVLADGILYIATIDGHLYAVDVASKAVKWSFNGDGALASIWGKPVITNDAVFIGDEDGNVYAVNKSNGKALWSSPFATGSAVVSGGVAIDDQVVFASNDGKIFMINESKEPKTLVTLEAVLYSPLGFDTDKIIVAPATKDKLFLALNTDGNEIWSYYPAK
jgi:outer membrane protein assembly factor BamB